MTLSKNKELNQNEIDSMKVAVEECDIRAIHPDKMEDFAEYLVRKARQSEQCHKEGRNPPFLCHIRWVVNQHSMPRARKKPSTVSQPVATEVKAPDVIISRQQYIEDIKVRWQIHQYEWNKLREDLNQAYEYLVPQFQKYRDYAVTAYQKEFRTDK